MRYLIDQSVISNWYDELPRWKNPRSWTEIRYLQPGINYFEDEKKEVTAWVYFVGQPSANMIFEDLLLSLKYVFNIKFNKENNRLELWIESKEGSKRTPTGKFSPYLYSVHREGNETFYDSYGYAYYNYISNTTLLIESQ